MASILDFLPIITTLAVGAGVWRLIQWFKPHNLRKTEYFNIFLLLGSFCLVIPLTLIGIQKEGILKITVGHISAYFISFSEWCLVYFLLGLVIASIIGYYSIRLFLRNLEQFKFDINSYKDYRIILIVFLLLDYLILELILPIRGFDALYYYFPEAEAFYQTDRITEINFYSFLPVVKSPLNVLLFVYCYYITGEFAVQLIPFLFLFGLVLLAYDFSLELFDNSSIAKIASIFTLVLPFTYWLMNYYAFYQDLYLCYFFSVTLYFSLKLYRSSLNFQFALFMCIGLILAIFTKITAWILPIILILWLPTGLKSKRIRIAIVPILGVFLCAQAATRIFIGTILPIIISLGVTTFLIYKEKRSGDENRLFYRFIPIGVGMIVGSFWLINRMSLSSLVGDEIFESYFKLTQEIKWFYPQQPLNPLLHTLETVHRINFFSAAGILLLGTCFVLPWLILKMFALRDFRQIVSPLIWVLVFFSIWIAYYLNSSMRYLTPIIIPMILCISWGFYQLTLKITCRGTQEFSLLLFAFIGCFNFYYLIPLDSLVMTGETQEIIGSSYNQAAFNYYSLSPFPFLIIRICLTTFFNLIILAIINKDQLKQLFQKFPKTVRLSWLSKFFQFQSYKLATFKNRMNFVWINRLLLCIIITIPLIVQSYLLFYTQGDLAGFHGIYEYEYREEYQEISTVLQQQNQPLTAILTVRNPGLQFFTKQPVLDIYYQNNFFLGNPFFTSTNLTELIDILQHPFNHTVETDFVFNLDMPIKYIVVPSYNNLYYSIYITQIKEKSFFFQSLTYNSSFLLLFKNSDFLLYEVIF